MIRTAPALRPVAWAALALMGFAALSTPAQAARNPRTANTAPVISGTPATTATTGMAYAFQPTASDADGNPLSFRIKNKPAWASFSSSTGRLSGTPTVAQAYTSISIRVSDGKIAVALPTFSIQALAPIVVVNRAPTITGTAASSVLVGTGYYFKPTGYDADGDVLVYAIVNKPLWAVFDAGTGVVSGTPPVTATGTYGNISIGVSDGTANAALAAFSITVTAPANHAPTISGVPVTSGEVGRPYAFHVTAADADGDPITFAIAGKPTWAAFDTTGTLHGTPLAGNVGTYPGIIITASDGKLTTALASFSITVSAAPTRTVTLNWTAPSMNVDGTALTDLAGYAVSYGTASHSYTTTINVVGAGSTSVVIEGLESGTWYFAMKSENVPGVQSDYTGEVVAVL